MSQVYIMVLFFFFNITAPTDIYTLSLHDALPILARITVQPVLRRDRLRQMRQLAPGARRPEDRKSTRLNSSHSSISYAVFCLKKKMDLVVDLQGRRLTGNPSHGGEQMLALY